MKIQINPNEKPIDLKQLTLAKLMEFNPRMTCDQSSAINQNCIIADVSFPVIRENVTTDLRFGDVFEFKHKGQWERITDPNWKSGVITTYGWQGIRIVFDKRLNN